MLSLPRFAALAIAAAMAVTPALAVAKTSDPETDKSLGPEDGAGHYFGGQSSTGQFHGCRKYDDAWYPTSLLTDQPVTIPTTHHYVTFTISTTSLPIFSWKAKSGYTICGVEAYAALTGVDTGGTEFLTWFSYKSGATKGSTAVKGRETVKVHMPSDVGSDNPDLKAFANKTVGIDQFQALTVYVKKK